MRATYDALAVQCCKETTQRYSTSFSIACRFLSPGVRDAVCAVYGFVRLADEIVDTFLEYDRKALLQQFQTDTQRAIESGVSFNPILHAFQGCVHRFGIPLDLIDAFFRSMAADLTTDCHDAASFSTYIYGSAEVVALMCLRIFVNGDEALYDENAAAARALGAAFQKVNFLRDLKYDTEVLGRRYFPDSEMITAKEKHRIEADVERDFHTALPGIRRLPDSSRFGVYVAYTYFRALFRKLQSLPPDRLGTARVRVSDYHKAMLLLHSSFLYWRGIR